MAVYPQSVTEYCRSTTLAAETASIVVSLPTFRRPDHLIATLKSLEAQRNAADLAVIVMENDADGLAGAKAAAAWLKTSTLSAVVIVAHQRGNCHAYNAGWAMALNLFPAFSHLAVIDDDEIATPDWLTLLLATATRTGADLVGGPQQPIFIEERLDSWRMHPVFASPYGETGPVPILYSSGNVMMARRVLETMPQPFLDPAFNFIGGGDSDFYRRCKAAGFKFAWCAQAAVLETVPDRRTEFSWLNARSLRNGAISAMIEKRQDPSMAGRVKALAKSMALLAASPWRGIRLGLRTRSFVTGLYHMQVAIGRLMAEFGFVNEQYRNPEAN